MATKELTEILQTAGAAGDASIGLSASGGLVRRDSVPFDADGSSANSTDTDLFIGVSVSGDARMFNAIPYIKDDTAATPAVGDLVIGQGSDGSAKQFTVASLAVTLEGESFGTGAFTNVGTVATLDTGTASGEVPTNGDLGTGAYSDNEEDSLSNPLFYGSSTFGTATIDSASGILTRVYDGKIANLQGYYEVSSFTGVGNLYMSTAIINQFDAFIDVLYDTGAGYVRAYGYGSAGANYFEFFNNDGTQITCSPSFNMVINGTFRRGPITA